MYQRKRYLVGEQQIQQSIPLLSTVFEEYKEGYTDLGDLFDENKLTRSDLNTITFLSMML